MSSITRRKRTRNKRTTGVAKRVEDGFRRQPVEDLPLPSLEEMEEIFAAAILNAVAELSPVERAQLVVREAWEARTEGEAVALAREALEISSDCAHAYVILAELTALTVEEAGELYRKGVEAGERVLGKETFQTDVGHFWEILKTRPYMEARKGLAECLWAAGQRDEALGHYWDLLRLNPNDNQGIRYCLMPCLIEHDQDKEARRLHRKYKNDGRAYWAYSKALLDFRKHGAGKRADKSLKAAFKANKHVPDYLLDPDSLPDALPEYISPGDDDEAVEYAFSNWFVWDHTPVALYWLASRW